jgi:hypothetical protein
MRLPLALLLLAASLGRAAEPPSPTDVAAAAAAKKKGCEVPAPLPLLRKDAYPDHEFRYGKENTATETASTGTVKIEIDFAGCTDGYEHSFSFIQSQPKTTFDDRDHWLDFAAAQMKALQTWRRGREDVKDLVDFLSGAKIATTRKSGSELRLEICRDGSPSTEDGCSKSSGGGWRFAVRALDKGRVEVYVSRYLANKP